jgi:hypothetical protein
MQLSHLLTDASLIATVARLPHTATHQVKPVRNALQALNAQANALLEVVLLALYQVNARIMEFAAKVLVYHAQVVSSVRHPYIAVRHWVVSVVWLIVNAQQIIATLKEVVHHAVLQANAQQVIALMVIALIAILHPSALQRIIVHLVLVEFVQLAILHLNALKQTIAIMVCVLVVV